MKKSNQLQGGLIIWLAIALIVIGILFAFTPKSEPMFKTQSTEVNSVPASPTPTPDVNVTKGATSIDKQIDAELLRLNKSASEIDASLNDKQLDVMN